MRYLHPYLLQDLKKKMVFLGGPRQCGKTTQAKSLLSEFQGRYFNWDLDEHRSDLLKKTWSDEDSLLVFDELHKFPRWKNWIKGLYDTSHPAHKFLVTGSARLDVYRRGGDSLLGRYHYWRLHPFTIDELPGKLRPAEAYRRLMSVGGFPEPFLDNDEREARRWRQERITRVLREDVRDLESIRDIQTLSLFVEALRTRVGGLCVLSNIAQDLQISPVTAARWLEALERMYVVFVVRPYTKQLPRAVQKTPKVYFFDNADVIGDEGARFENLVATHLLKRIQFRQDYEGYKYELAYLRDKEGREVDFVITRDGKPVELIEVKHADASPHKGLLHYAEKLNPERAVQVTGDLKRASHTKGKFELRNAVEAFARPPWRKG